MTRSVLYAHLGLVMAMIIWGSSFMAIKIAVSELSPVVVVAWRMIIGSIALLVLWGVVRPKFDYQKGDWRYLLGLALFEPCFYMVFESEGLQHTSAGQAGMVAALLPLMVAAAAYVFLREKNTLRQWLGFFVAVAGVIGMTLLGEVTDQAPNALLGNLLMFLAMTMAVGYTLLVKHLITRYSAFVMTAIQAFMGAIFFFPLAMFSDWQVIPSQSAIIAIIYLGVIVTIGAYGLYNFSMNQVKASTAAGYANLLPVFSLFFSMVFLGERLEISQWVCVAVVFMGVYLSQEKDHSVEADQNR